MAIDTTQAPKGNGLKTAIDIVIAPKEALEAIGIAPTWGWAYLIAVVLAVGAYFVMLPAVQHAMAADMLINPQIAQLSPEKQQSTIKTFLGFAPLFAVIPPIAMLFFGVLEAVVMLIFNAIGHGAGKFKTLFAASMNIGIIYALGQVVAAVVVLVRGADSFPNSASVAQAVPSLALLAPGAGTKLVAFLATVTPFSIWSVILVAMTMTIVARVPKVHAWLAAIFSFIIPSLFAVLGAK